MTAEAPSNQWLALIGLAWTIVGSMGVFVFGGVWLDGHFRTTPLFIILGALLGILGSGWSIYKTVSRLDGNTRGKQVNRKADGTL